MITLVDGCGAVVDMGTSNVLELRDCVVPT